MEDDDAHQPGLEEEEEEEEEERPAAAAVDPAPTSDREQGHDADEVGPATRTEGGESAEQLHEQARLGTEARAGAAEPMQPEEEEPEGVAAEAESAGAEAESAAVEAGAAPAAAAPEVAAAIAMDEALDDGAAASPPDADAVAAGTTPERAAVVLDATAGGLEEQVPQQPPLLELGEAHPLASAAGGDTQATELPLPLPLPRPRALPPPLSISVSSSSAPPPAPSPWPLFHSPRGNVLPVSPVGGGGGYPHMLQTQASEDDTYEDEGLGPDFLASPWRAPSVERAERFAARNLVAGGRAPILWWWHRRRTSSSVTAPAPASGDGSGSGPPEVDTQEEAAEEAAGVDLAELGLGVQLHFKLLQVLLQGFTVLALLSVPALVLFHAGTRLGKDKADLLGFYTYMLGNMGTSEGSSGNSTLHVRLSLLGRVVSLQAQDASVLVASMEVASCIVLALLIAYASWTVSRGARRTKRRLVSTHDFAVLVTGLPGDTTKEEIIEHFSDRFPPLPLPTTGQQPKLPVQEQDLVPLGGDARYAGTWVAEVVIARKNGPILRMALAHKEKTLGIRRLRALVKRHAPATAPDGLADPRLFEQHRQELERLETSMRRRVAELERDARLRREEQECVGAAFVVFEWLDSKERCLREYNSNHLQNLFQNFCCCFPERLLFRGTHRIKVQPAPAPDDVMWEILDVGDAKRFLHGCLVGIVLVLCFAVLFLVVVVVTHHKTRLAARLPDFGLCRREIPALYGYDRVPAPSLQTPATIAEAYDWCGGQGGPGGFYAIYSTSSSPLLAPDPSFSLAACTVDPCPGTGSGGRCPCLASDSGNGLGRRVCRTLGGKSFPYSTVASCFCLELLQGLVASSGGRLSLGKLASCSHVARSLAAGAFTQLALSLFTLSISTYVLPPLVRWLTAFERHRSSDAEASRVVERLFAAQFLNQALLLIIVYGGHSTIRGGTATWARALRALGVFAGPYEDFTHDWYAVVGTQLTLNAFIAALTPHVWPLFCSAVLAPARRLWAQLSEVWLGRGPAFALQRDLNALYVGPQFDVVTRAAQLLSITTFALAFSAGLPLLLPLAVLALALSLGIDYYLLLRFYQRPPHRDERLHRNLCQFLPYALLLHLSLAIWMLSNDEVLGSGNGNSGGQPLIPRASSDDGNGDGSSSSSSDADLHVLAVVIARVSQAHVWPLTTLWLLAVLYVVVVDVLPTRQVSAAAARLLAVWRATCGGRTRRSRRVSSETDAASTVFDVRYDNGFTKAFVSGDPSGSSPRSTAAGRPRTWEVLKATGLHSYELHRHPRYREAVLAFARFCRPGGMGKSLHGSLAMGAGPNGGDEEEGATVGA